MASVHVDKITTLTGHKDCVYTLEEIPDSPSFFSGAGDGMIVRWTHGNPEGDLIAKMNESVYALTLDTSTDLLLAGHNYDGLHILDWKAKKEMGSVSLTSAAIFDIKVKGRLALVASGDGVVSVVDLDSLTVLQRLASSGQNARTIALHPSGKEMAVGYSDKFIRLFRLDDFALIKEFQAHQNSVFTVRYSPDGRWLMSGSRDARLKVWDVEGDYALHEEIAAHLYAINDIRFSPDSKHFVTCSMDKSVKVWRLDDLTLLKVIDRARHAGHGTSVNKLLWCSFNNQIVSASDDRTISIWDVIF
jgi:WD40 repeat protein